MTRWTDEQKMAINASGRAVLVSAAAGSGKTAVLVEKLRRLLTDSDDPVFADRIIVVTFTKDAAAQMRDKLTDSLSKLLEEDGITEEEAGRISAQISLLPSANISTIHSFCFRLIRENAGKAGVDPSFAIAPPEDEGEIVDKAVSEVFGEWIDSRRSDMTMLTEFFCGGDRSIDSLAGIVKGLREKYLSLPFPEEKMRSVAEYYRENSVKLLPGEGVTAEYIRMAVRRMKYAYETAQALYFYLCGIRTDPPGQGCDDKTEKNLLANIETVGDDCSLLKGLYEKISREAEDIFSGNSDKFSLFEPSEIIEAGKPKTDKKTGAVTGYSDRRISSVSYDNDGTVTDVGEVIRGVRKIYFDSASGLYEFAHTGAKTPKGKPPMRFTSDEIKSDYRVHAEILGWLFELVIGVTERERIIKSQRNVLGYSDAEQICCSLLCRREEGKVMPSEIALAAAAGADIVMIDEFQDSTEVQELIFSMISRGGSADVPGTNFFAVGDVKQSIYRFRSAEPELFIKSLADSVPYEDNGETIPSHILLSRNFRSSRPVTEFVNRFFKTVMSEEMGGVDYGDDECLVYGRAESSDPPPVEVIDVSEDLALEFAEMRIAEEEAEGKTASVKIKDIDRAEAEAAAVAARIRQLLREDPSAVPSEFCILSRYRHYLPVYEKALKKLGIECVSGDKEDLLDTGEVLAVVNLLRAIDNPWKDVPLMNAMMSPLFMFTAEEMAQIRLFGDDSASLYGRIIAAAASEESSPQLKGRCSEFLSHFDRLRDHALTCTAEEMILYIYEDMDYIAVIAGTENGRKKVRYLRRLPFAAADFARRGDGSLRGFIRRIDTLGKDGIPVTAAAGEGAVILQTIHGSKGLEYPYVFLCGSSYKPRRNSGEFFFSSSAGVGLRITENLQGIWDTGGLTPPERLRYMSLPACTIDELSKKSELDEDMMLLYVALTRAEKRLFITRTGSSGEIEAIAVGAAMSRAAGGGTDIKKCDPIQSAVKNLSDIIAAGLTGFKLTENAREFIPGSNEICLTKAEDIILPDESKTEADGEAGEPARETAADEVMTERIKELLTLPCEDDLSEVPAKLTVTELARRGEEIPVRPPVFPVPEGFGSEGAADGEEEFPWEYSDDEYAGEDFSEKIIRPVSGHLSASDRGTAVHAFMQYADFGRLWEAEDIYAEIARELDEIADRGLLTREQAAAVDPEVIARFTQSGLFERMMKKGEFMRERKFLVKISDLGLDDEDLKVYTNTEGCLQGVADLIFRDDDGYVLCDYKTDRFVTRQSLEKRYSRQISLYAAAFSLILDAPVRETWIYAFDLYGKGGAVRIDI